MEKILQKAVDAHAFPCGVLACIKENETRIFSAGTAFYGKGFKPTADDLFDVASISKVLSTTPIAMIAVDRGLLELDRPVKDYLPDFAAGDTIREKITPRHLLSHSSGLPAYYHFHQTHSGLTNFETQCRLIRQLPLEYMPGTKSSYSCMGMITLMQILEKQFGERLNTLVRKLIYAPLGMKTAGYLPDKSIRCIPTEENKECPGEFWCGTVHDEVARWLGGISGNAGIFCSVNDAVIYARMLLEGGTKFFTSETFREFTTRAGIVPGSSRCLGWNSPSQDNGLDCCFSSTSFGHTGFTGTTLWIDRDKGIAVVFFTNAVNPHRECKAQGFFPWRNKILKQVTES